MKPVLNESISNAYRMDEAHCLDALITEISFSDEQLLHIQNMASGWIEHIRKNRLEKGGIDALLQTYDLSSEEGIALMRLAEALLRVPDSQTRDRLIQDKIVDRDWKQHLNKEGSFWVNAATLSLLLTGKVLGEPQEKSIFWEKMFKRVISRASSSLIRGSVTKVMEQLGQYFVISETIEGALQQAKNREKKGYRYSYDMIGEAAKTARDAEEFYKAYHSAIQAIDQEKQEGSPIQAPGISVKLSALHPRFEWVKRDRVTSELFPRLRELALRAKEANIGLTIDAEEADRLELSLLLVEHLLKEPNLAGWGGLGVAVQAYQKRASAVIDWLIETARSHQTRIMVRLVKGAYWDSEIKWTEERGLKDYPVFTRKVSTDISYLACAKKILTATDVLYPQFATHNAYTVAAILEMAGHYRDFEFQCLQGMGNSLYDPIVADKNLNIPCRIYAPVGEHEHLLAYLVRRLLENGANSSFVNQIGQTSISLAAIVEDPIKKIRTFANVRHPKIPLPKDMYLPHRVNSNGVDFSNATELDPLIDNIQSFCPHLWQQPINPIEDVAEISVLLSQGHAAAGEWNRQTIEVRTACLERMAELLEEHKSELLALLIREAGKTVQDAASELREAIDYCGYYAYRCREDFTPKRLPGPTGESNQLILQGRGLMVCISPWNFPLAIFLGQILAALAAGNAVIAKPANQTPSIAQKVVSLLHQAGIPNTVVQLLIASGHTVSAHVLTDERVQGVLFTGSTEIARQINQQLAVRQGPIVPLIAETGGQNAMIVDSTALLEQVVGDVVTSAFNSAGQRCSALRVLFVQEDIAPRLLAMLKGAMAELTIGDPLDLATDIGPVIDSLARDQLVRHANRLDRDAQLLYECPLPNPLPLLPKGVFFAPRLYLIDNMALLTEEIFGPILPVVSYKSQELDNVIAAITESGYGLTLGIHSRIDATVEYIQQRVRVGNIYVNRNMIGAVVGVQPFGGEGLSGTGPKAGGPYLLPRLAVERTISVNTAASGGNVTLMTLKED